MPHFTAYTGIHGNEIAGELARNGSSAPFAGPQRATGISRNDLQSIVITIFDIFKKKQYLNWSNIKLKNLIRVVPVLGIRNVLG